MTILILRPNHAPQLVKLRYFKASGEYHSSAKYLTDKQHLFEIWDEVRKMQDEGKLPGLVEGERMPFIYVNVPKHQHRHPALIVDPQMRST